MNRRPIVFGRYGQDSCYTFISLHKLIFLIKSIKNLTMGFWGFGVQEG